jgi:hypothetical protein
MQKLTTSIKLWAAFCVLLLSTSLKSQNTVIVGDMNTQYISNNFPFDNYYNYSWANTIYLSSEIGQGGKITQIAFYVYQGNNISMASQKILMRETTASSYSSSTYPGESGFTTVFNGTITYNFSGGSGWQVITLTTPFTYSGTNNLEMLFENNSGSYTNNFEYYDVTTTSSNRVRRDYNDASYPSSCVNCGAYSYIPNVQLTIACTSTVSISPSSATICNGNNTTLTASGASSYSWSPATSLSSGTGASVTASPSSTTNYMVTALDGSACIQTKTVTVTVNPLPSVSISPATPSICVGGTVALTASGASTYSWSPATGLSASTGASVTANPSATTTYTVTGTNSNGCVKTQTVLVTVNSPATLTFSPSAPTICVGSTTTITASGASTYSWSPATNLNTTSGATVAANPSSTTTYSISSAGSNGCVGTTTLSVAVNALPTLTLSPSSPAVCNGGTVALSASGANTYSWSPATNLSATTGASVNANPTTATNYTLTGTNTNGCINTKAFTVNVNGLPTLAVSPTSATICVGNNTSLTANGASTYSWSPATGLNNANSANVTANPTSTTNYTVSGTNANGCVGTTTVTVNVNPLPTLSITASPTAICVGASSTLTASGASTYSWSPATGLSSANTANVMANPTSTTNYTASGTDANGCIGNQTINLVVNPLPSISISPSSPIVLGGQGPTITANGANTYSWSPATNLNTTTGATVTAMPQITTGYTLTGTSAAGCVNQTPFSVGVELWQQTADTFHAPIYYNGNVGIGTNNPQAALDVIGNAIITGTLTTGGLNSTSSNLNVTTPAVFKDSVTLSSLATATTTTGSGNRYLLLKNNGVIVTGGGVGQTQSVNSCNSLLPSWTIGGDNLAGLTPSTGGDLALGTCDQNDLVFKAGGSKALWLTPAGTLGVGISAPQAMVHINTTYSQSGNATPGLIIDDQDPSENTAEFTVNSDGTTKISVLPSISLGGFPDAFSVNTQDPHFQGCLYCAGTGTNAYYNLFRIDRATGHVGIGTAPTSNVSSYKMLTVSGDASFANYNASGNGNTADGITAIEILGNNQVPTRRGITVDNDPNGDFNFYINSNQSSSQFNFVNGANGVVSSSNPAIATIGSTGMSIGNDGAGNTTVPVGYQLAVYGKIIAQEVVVKLLPWPDYVFTKNYKLKNLLDLENYINENHHLPNIPAAKDIESSGVQLGDMVGKQMEKIEELTLYMIEMKKEIEKLKQENKELKVLINK